MILIQGVPKEGTTELSEPCRSPGRYTRNAVSTWYLPEVEIEADLRMRTTRMLD